LPRPLRAITSPFKATKTENQLSKPPGFSPSHSIISKKKRMPFIRVWIHYVWSTKNREPVLTDKFRNPLFEHIKENAKVKKIYLDRVNGYHDHVHCLLSLGSDQTIAKMAQLIKGEFSYWFNNKSSFKACKLEWQDEYWAVSVCESRLNSVRTYIDNQPAHHRKKTFDEEYRDFSIYGFKQFG